MEVQDLDSKETILGMRKKLNYGAIVGEIVEILNGNKDIVLATSFNDRVTARTVSFTNNDLIIYFMSWVHNKKIEQIKKNPKVALCLRNLQIEGEAQILGFSYEEKNKNNLEIFKKKFSEFWINTFSAIREMVTVKIVPNAIVKFENINKRFQLQVINVKNKTAFQMRLEDKDNPNFPY